MPADEHIPLHAYMMALAIKLITTTQFGAYFKKDSAIKSFHLAYEEVSFLKMIFLTNSNLFCIISAHDGYGPLANRPIFKG